MADPTQNDENKKPKKEEVSAADLLSLWGGGASPAKPAQSSAPAPVPEPKPAPVPVTKPEPQPPKPVPTPQPAPPPAPKPEPASLQPKPAPSPVPEPIKKTIQPETAFWEAAAPASPEIHAEEPIPFQPQKQAKQIKIEPEIFQSEEEKPLPKEPKKETIKEKAPPEIVEGEVIKSEPLPPIEEPAALDEEETFGSQVDEFLAELNLSRKHIFYGIGCLVLIIVLVFGGIWGYKFYKNRKSSQPIEPTKEEQTQSVIEDTSIGIISTSQVGGKFDPSLVGDTGISSAVSIGVELSGAAEIAGYIMTFRRLQNAYETDINELLNQSTDRRGRLNSHLALLNKLYSDGSLVSANLKSQMDQLKAQYEEKKKQQQTFDANFFDQIKALNPQTTENILADFIAVSQEIVSLRARFKSLQKINSYYQYALPKLNARIKDIELNAEPLILGLKVYDVKGSDVKLIVPVEGGGGSSEKTDSLESAPGFPLMINPASVDTGHDYITKPGGGF